MHHKDTDGELSCTASHCSQLSSQPHIYIAIWKSLVLARYRLGRSLGVSNFLHQGRPSKDKKYQGSTSIVRSSSFIGTKRENTICLFSHTRKGVQF